jgi:hypothetical protein
MSAAALGADLAAIDVRLAAIDVRLTAIDGTLVNLAAAVAPLPTHAHLAAAVAAAVAPLPTHAHLAAAVAPLQAQLNAIAAALGIAGAGAGAIRQARALARRANAAASDTPFIVLPLAGGGAPAAWPADFDRAALAAMPAAAAQALLAAYGLPGGGSLDTKRLRLARYIGAAAL